MNRTNLAVEEENFNEFENINTAESKKYKHKIEKITHPKLVYYFIKRTFDIVAGIIGILILIPLSIFVFIMRIIKKENDGPMFYKQLRIGKNGKEIRIFKYRTMVMNADEKLVQYLEENEEAAKEYKKYKKLRKDPRITKVGAFLRKTSLDEFPQFINVLLGQMSVVGPRPYLHREKKDMDWYYDKIIKVKPGITGYWQVNGRSDVDFKDRLIMDTYYMEHKSLVMDTKIIIKTAMKIFKKEGAI